MRKSFQVKVHNQPLVHTHIGRGPPHKHKCHWWGVMQSGERTPRNCTTQLWRNGPYISWWLRDRLGFCCEEEHEDQFMTITQRSLSIHIHEIMWVVIHVEATQKPCHFLRSNSALNHSKQGSPYDTLSWRPVLGRQKIWLTDQNAEHGGCNIGPKKCFVAAVYFRQKIIVSHIVRQGRFNVLEPCRALKHMGREQSMPTRDSTGWQRECPIIHLTLNHNGTHVISVWVIGHHARQLVGAQLTPHHQPASSTNKNRVKEAQQTTQTPLWQMPHK